MIIPCSHLSCFLRTLLSNPFVLQQQLRPACSPLSELTASLCSSAAAAVWREECQCVVWCVCMCECNYSLQYQRLPSCLLLISRTGHNTSLLLILKVGPN